MSPQKNNWFQITFYVDENTVCYLNLLISLGLLLIPRGFQRIPCYFQTFPIDFMKFPCLSQQAQFRTCFIDLSNIQTYYFLICPGLIIPYISRLDNSLYIYMWQFSVCSLAPKPLTDIWRKWILNCELWITNSEVWILHSDLSIVAYRTFDLYWFSTRQQLLRP